MRKLNCLKMIDSLFRTGLYSNIIEIEEQILPVYMKFIADGSHSGE